MEATYNIAPTTAFLTKENKLFESRKNKKKHIIKEASNDFEMNIQSIFGFRYLNDTLRISIPLTGMLQKLQISAPTIHIRWY